MRMDGMKVMRNGVFAHVENGRLFCHFEEEKQGERPPHQIHRHLNTSRPPSRDTVRMPGVGPSE